VIDWMVSSLGLGGGGWFFSLERSSFLLVGFVSSGSHSYPSRDLSGKWRDNLINAISNPERLK